MDMEIGNGNGEAVTANPGLDNANISSLIVFARDVIRLALGDTLCRRTVEDTGAQYGVVEFDDEGRTQFAGWLAPLVEMFDTVEHDHLNSEDADNDEGGDGAEGVA